jgi:hypothetical protein
MEVARVRLAVGLRPDAGDLWQVSLQESSRGSGDGGQKLWDVQG